MQHITACSVIQPTAARVLPCNISLVKSFTRQSLVCLYWSDKKYGELHHNAQLPEAKHQKIHPSAWLVGDQKMIIINITYKL